MPPVPRKSALAESLRKPLAPASAGPPHLIVKALAGTGKTTTIVEGVRQLRGLPTSVDPSPQQAAVWAELAKSKGRDKFVGFVAFNKSIAEHLKTKIPPGCDAMTTHSLGFKAVRKTVGNPMVDEHKTLALITAVTGIDSASLRSEKFMVCGAVKKLVDLVKQNLVGGRTREELTGRDPSEWAADLTELARHYDVTLENEETGANFADEVFELVPEVIEECLDLVTHPYVDFTDMIWLPVVLGLPMFVYDILLCDELQDFNRCQQALTRRACRRFVGVGDTHQAIYGFAGADSRSMGRMFEELSATPAGCVELPLTVTYRCGKAVVKEAQKYVPEFEAHESNSAGKIAYDQYAPLRGVNVTQPKRNYRENVGDADMVLCRTNAPLVQQCFAFLGEGRKAMINGRDVAQSLITMVSRFKAKDMAELNKKLAQWYDREYAAEQARANPSESKLINISDKYGCLSMFCEGMESPKAVVDRIQSVFTDDPDVKGVLLSSIHRAKGLEAKKIWFLMPKNAPCPHPMAKSAWQKEQELHLLYVGITRAVETLTYVVDAPPR